ncbi:hypothetical protein L1987_45287 [Smallanthus sonchifolius]|uniref:Uncharacterized protein n=1 Tax=Smallanthus sonchifolius TaxID=185202 RepID=A0ACB9GSG5_9ASTR|nr:hypothetical protein L1987_45287 [Smallanthus sonchifolius]
MRDEGWHGWKGLYQHIWMWLGETLDSSVFIKSSCYNNTWMMIKSFFIIEHMCVLHVDLGQDLTIVDLTALIKFNPFVQESYAARIKHVLYHLMTTVITQILPSWEPGQPYTSIAKEALYLLTEFAQTRLENVARVDGSTWLHALCDIEDDPTHENSHMFDCAEESPTRLINALDVNNFFEFALGHLKVCSLSSEWRNRHVALISLVDLSKGRPQMTILSDSSPVACVE